jgi:5'(3')-deoxyribonucleotidase
MIEKTDLKIKNLQIFYGNEIIHTATHPKVVSSARFNDPAFYPQVEENGFCQHL